MRNNQKRLGGQSPAPTDPPPQSHNTLSYTVPTEFVELPSRGLFYPEGHPLHNQETVEIKYMTAKEEDILSSTALIKKGIVLDRLLQNLLVDNAIDPRTLVVGDRNAIMVAARISAYGEKYETRITCPVCSTSLPFTFNLRTDQVKGACFDEDFLKENDLHLNDDTKTFSLKLPVCQMTVEVGILSTNQVPDEGDSEAPITSALSAFIVSVNGDSNPVSIRQFVHTMPAADARHLRKIYKELAPNIDLSDVFRCAACFHSEEMGVPLNAEFFWPG
tara:strand:- start:554 stop:1378 length:825 start_codon:yes stop_codon:yes gene_type:complete